MSLEDLLADHEARLARLEHQVDALAQSLHVLIVALGHDPQSEG